MDHTGLAAQGPLRQVSLYYSPAAGCLRGAKVSYASPSGPVPGMLGNSINTSEAALKLNDGEAVTAIEARAGR